MITPSIKYSLRFSLSTFYGTNLKSQSQTLVEISFLGSGARYGSFDVSISLLDKYVSVLKVHRIYINFTTGSNAAYSFRQLSNSVTTEIFKVFRIDNFDFYLLNQVFMPQDSNLC